MCKCTPTEKEFLKTVHKLIPKCDQPTKLKYSKLFLYLSCFETHNINGIEVLETELNKYQDINQLNINRK